MLRTVLPVAVLTTLMLLLSVFAAYAIVVCVCCFLLSGSIIVLIFNQYSLLRMEREIWKWAGVKSHQPIR